MLKLATYSVGTVILGAAVAWVLTEPRRADFELINALTPNLERGAYIYTAGGCASCHAGTDGNAQSLTGGMALENGRRSIWPMRCCMAPRLQANIITLPFPIPLTPKWTLQMWFLCTPI